MDDHIPQALLKDNVVDRAAGAASKAVDATKTATSAALDSVADRVESMRSTLSPALDSAMTPLDSVMRYTRAQPLTALACAAAIGALLSALLAPTRRARK